MAKKKEDRLSVFQDRMLDEGYKVVSLEEIKDKQAQVADQQKKAASKTK